MPRALVIAELRFERVIVFRRAVLGSGLVVHRIHNGYWF